jgi:hypothetical protein
MSDDAAAKSPEAFGVKAINTSKDVPWFLKSIRPHLMRPALVDLLEKYGGIPREEQEKHLHEVVRIPHHISRISYLIFFLSTLISPHLTLVTARSRMGDIPYAMHWPLVVACPGHVHSP